MLWYKIISKSDNHLLFNDIPGASDLHRNGPYGTTGHPRQRPPRTLHRCHPRALPQAHVQNVTPTTASQPTVLPPHTTAFPPHARPLAHHRRPPWLPGRQPRPVEQPRARPPAPGTRPRPARGPGQSMHRPRGVSPRRRRPRGWMTEDRPTWTRLPSFAAAWTMAQGPMRTSSPGGGTAVPRGCEGRKDVPAGAEEVRQVWSSRGVTRGRWRRTGGLRSLSPDRSWSERCQAEVSKDTIDGMGFIHRATCETRGAVEKHMGAEGERIGPDGNGPTHARGTRRSPPRTS